MSFRNMTRAAVLALSGLVGATAVQAGPITLTYEGDLVGNGGAPAQGEHELSFSLYPSAAGGEAVWAEVHPEVLVVDGHFFVDLGTRVSLEGVGSADDVLFLGVSVDFDAEAEPRMTVGGALRAQWAALAANAQDVRDADIQPRSVSLAGTPTRLENGSLRLGPEVNQVLTAPSLATLTGGGDADALHTHAGQVAAGPRFLGLTAAGVTGAMGGVVGANVRCSAQYPSSHMCSYCEYLATNPTAGGPAWINPPYNSGSVLTCPAGSPYPLGVPGINTGTRTCNGWESAASQEAGILAAGGGFAASAVGNCQNEYPIACCAN